MVAGTAPPCSVSSVDLGSSGLSLIFDSFSVAFGVTLATVAFVTATALSNPACRDVYPERKPQEHKSSLHWLPAGYIYGVRDMLGTADLSPSALSHLGRQRPAQPTNHRAPHGHVVAAGRGVPLTLCAPLPGGRPLRAKWGAPLPAPIPASEMWGTSAARRGAQPAGQTQLTHLTGCSVPGS